MSYISPGRPSELPDDTIKKIEILRKHNVPATAIAKKFQLSRQRVYYYFKKWPSPTVMSIDEILRSQSLEQESMNG